MPLRSWAHPDFVYFRALDIKEGAGEKEKKGGLGVKAKETVTDSTHANSTTWRILEDCLQHGTIICTNKQKLQLIFSENLYILCLRQLFPVR